MPLRSSWEQVSGEGEPRWICWAAISRTPAGVTCSCRPHADGEVFTWGKSARGRLGRKDEEARNPGPVQLEETHPYVVISVSCCHGNTLLAVKRKLVGSWKFGKWGVYFRVAPH